MKTSRSMLCVSDVARQLVAFHARLSSSVTLSSGVLKPFNNILYNAGQAFSGTTGEFTAPYSGVYFFIGSTGSKTGGAFSNVDLVKAGSALARTYIEQNGTFDNAATCHATVHVRAGEKVWLRPFSSSTFSSDVTHFSGFLLHAD